jgi:hypothetical protein
VKVTTKNANPSGRGRLVDRPVASWGAGCSSTGLGQLAVTGPDTVSIHVQHSDGAGASASSRTILSFHLDDDPDMIDALIGNLTALRDRQKQELPRTRHPMGVL